MCYTTKGSVRGCCGHKHRSLKAAVQCLRSDQTGCARQGGYSDRQITRTDGSELDEGEIYAIDNLLDELLSDELWESQYGG